MREIKFRFYSLSGMPGMRYPSRWDSVDLEETDTWKVMQFTGLHDRNGKEIWEGDILGFDRFSHWVVVYQAPSFCIYNVCDPTVIHTITLGNIDFREVIGNIYENPELLK
jgi:uncharacterized phage protein (TIGR01671 family)